MLKENIKTIKKNGLNYTIRDGKYEKHSSWIGDLIAGGYDRYMENRVFPNLFNAGFSMHEGILKSIYKDYKDLDILELGTGSGSVSKFLNTSNRYSGIDISKRLLKQAHKAFLEQGFNDCDLYVCSADVLPFKDGCFDVCICNLSLNFFPNLNQVLSETKRVLKTVGKFVCSIPLSDKMEQGKKTRGTQFTLNNLCKIMDENGFSFDFLENNGALVYFECICEKNN